MEREGVPKEDRTARIRSLEEEMPPKEDRPSTSCGVVDFEPLENPGPQPILLVGRGTGKPGSTLEGQAGQDRRCGKDGKESWPRSDHHCLEGMAGWGGKAFPERPSERRTFVVRSYPTRFSWPAVDRFSQLRGGGPSTSLCRPGRLQGM